MAEAVIVSAARSPIGRAYKGSLREMRGDDLAAQMVQAALSAVPELDPHLFQSSTLCSRSRLAKQARIPRK